MIDITEKYIGKAWTQEYDCVSLAREVLLNEFCKEPPMPDNMDWKHTSVQDMKDLAKGHAVEIEEPKTGDLALMRILGSKRCLGSHIGVVFIVNHQVWILHNLERIGVLFQSTYNLVRNNLEVVAYYQVNE